MQTQAGVLRFYLVSTHISPCVLSGEHSELTFVTPARAPVLCRGRMSSSLHQAQSVTLETTN